MFLSVNSRESPLLLQGQATSSVFPCTDSDGGINSVIVGNVIGQINGSMTVLWDTCVDDRTLSEAYCAGSTPSLSILTCASTCDRGMCLQAPLSSSSSSFSSVSFSSVSSQPTCTDSDHGLNFFVHGTVTGTDGVQTGDVCLDNKTLAEAYCAISGTNVRTQVCPGVCRSGACVYSSSSARSSASSRSVYSSSQSICTDSDSGLNYYVRGTVTGTDGARAQDTCSNEKTLVEAYCAVSGKDSVVFTCPEICVNGACTSRSSSSSSQLSCTDSDGGQAYFVRGTVTGTDGRQTDDVCIDGKTLAEAYCTVSGSDTVIVACPEACVNGACASLPSSSSSVSSSSVRNACPVNPFVSGIAKGGVVGMPNPIELIVRNDGPSALPNAQISLEWSSAITMQMPDGRSCNFTMPPRDISLTASPGCSVSGYKTTCPVSLAPWQKKTLLLTYMLNGISGCDECNPVFGAAAATEGGQATVQAAAGTCTYIFRIPTLLADGRFMGDVQPGLAGSSVCGDGYFQSGEECEVGDSNGCQPDGYMCEACECLCTSSSSSSSSSCAAWSTRPLASVTVPASNAEGVVIATGLNGGDILSFQSKGRVQYDSQGAVAWCGMAVKFLNDSDIVILDTNAGATDASLTVPSGATKAKARFFDSYYPDNVGTCPVTSINVRYCSDHSAARDLSYCGPSSNPPCTGNEQDLTGGGACRSGEWCSPLRNECLPAVCGNGEEEGMEQCESDIDALGMVCVDCRHASGGTGQRSMGNVPSIFDTNSLHYRRTDGNYRCTEQEGAFHCDACTIRNGYAEGYNAHLGRGSYDLYVTYVASSALGTARYYIGNPHSPQFSAYVDQRSAPRDLYYKGTWWKYLGQATVTEEPEEENLYNNVFVSSPSSGVPIMDDALLVAPADYAFPSSTEQGEAPFDIADSQCTFFNVAGTACGSPGACNGPDSVCNFPVGNRSGLCHSYTCGNGVMEIGEECESDVQFRGMVGDFICVDCKGQQNAGQGSMGDKPFIIDQTIDWCDEYEEPDRNYDSCHSYYHGPSQTLENSEAIGCTYAVSTQGEKSPFTWFGITGQGRYDLYVSYPASSGLASAAVYKVLDLLSYDGTWNPDMFTVDQRIAPSDAFYAGTWWRKLGTVSVNEQVEITLLSPSGVPVAADAVMLAPVGYGFPASTAPATASRGFDLFNFLRNFVASLFAP